MKLVIVESPYAGTGESGTPSYAREVERNEAYARRAMRDCLLRGEAPYASHLLYTQPGVLSDLDPEERELGMQAGWAWGDAAALTVVYVDLGITRGMRRGIERAEAAGRPVERRRLGP